MHLAKTGCTCGKPQVSAISLEKRDSTLDPIFNKNTASIASGTTDDTGIEISSLGASPTLPSVSHHCIPIKYNTLHESDSVGECRSVVPTNEQPPPIPPKASKNIPPLPPKNPGLFSARTTKSNIPKCVKCGTLTSLKGFTQSALSSNLSNTPFSSTGCTHDHKRSDTRGNIYHSSANPKVPLPYRLVKPVHGKFRTEAFLTNAQNTFRTYASRQSGHCAKASQPIRDSITNVRAGLNISPLETKIQSNPSNCERSASCLTVPLNRKVYSRGDANSESDDFCQVDLRDLCTCHPELDQAHSLQRNSKTDKLTLGFVDSTSFSTVNTLWKPHGLRKSDQHIVLNQDSHMEPAFIDCSVRATKSSTLLNSQRLSVHCPRNSVTKSGCGGLKWISNTLHRIFHTNLDINKVSPKQNIMKSYSPKSSAILNFRGSHTNTYIKSRLLPRSLEDRQRYYSSMKSDSANSLWQRRSKSQDYPRFSSCMPPHTSNLSCLPTGSLTLQPPTTTANLSTNSDMRRNLTPATPISLDPELVKEFVRVGSSLNFNSMDLRRNHSPKSGRTHPLPPSRVDSTPPPPPKHRYDCPSLPTTLHPMNNSQVHHVHHVYHVHHFHHHHHHLHECGDPVDTTISCTLSPATSPIICDRQRPPTTIASAVSKDSPDHSDSVTYQQSVISSSSGSKEFSTLTTGHTYSAYDVRTSTVLHNTSIPTNATTPILHHSYQQQIFDSMRKKSPHTCCSCQQKLGNCGTNISQNLQSFSELSKSTHALCSIHDIPTDWVQSNVTCTLSSCPQTHGALPVSSSDSSNSSNTVVNVNTTSFGSSSTTCNHTRSSLHHETAITTVATTIAVTPIINTTSASSSGSRHTPTSVINSSIHSTCPLSSIVATHHRSGRTRLNIQDLSPAELQESRSSFHRSILELRGMGWYWGPLSFQEAQILLAKRPDGTFLVRDSGHDTYILSLSFRVRGETYHTRIEHNQGRFSFWSQPQSHSASTMVEFIEKAVAHSMNGQFHYFLQSNAQGQPPVEVPLLYPLSRFQVVPSLRHLTRFTILSSIRRDHIDQLPLPRGLLNYLMEKQCYAESLEEFEEAIRDRTPLEFRPRSITASNVSTEPFMDSISGPQTTTSLSLRSNNSSSASDERSGGGDSQTTVRPVD